MLMINKSLGKNDIEHIGMILVRIREGRGLLKKELAMKNGISNSTVTRIESSGNSHNNKDRLESLEYYIEALKKSRRPLTEEQIRFLFNLSEYSCQTHITESEKLLSTIQFFGLSNYQNTSLRPLFEQLEQEKNPSSIVDPLWFIHAMNGSMLRLFDIEPKSDHLNRWDSWQVIATKFHKDSLVRKAHYNPDIYFPPVIDKFFTDETASPYLFTIQMRLLLQRVHKLSAQNGFSFTSWWDAATSFSLNYELKHLNRIIIYQAKPIVVQASKPKKVNVEIANGLTIPFSTLSWEPFDLNAEAAFKDICNTPNSHQVYFAADYDKNQDFYVNNWPEFQNFSF